MLELSRSRVAFRFFAPSRPPRSLRVPPEDPGGVEEIHPQIQRVRPPEQGSTTPLRESPRGTSVQPEGSPEHDMASARRQGAHRPRQARRKGPTPEVHLPHALRAYSMVHDQLGIIDDLEPSPECPFYQIQVFG